MQRHKLTALGIKAAPDGKLQDGAGLILHKRGGAGKWIFRFSHLGRRRDMGLGPWPQLGLAEARAARDRWHGVLIRGLDPVDVRDSERQAAIENRDRSAATFAELVDQVFDARKGSLRGDGDRGRWLSPLATHMLPVLGKRKISKLTRADYLEALRPIWARKHPTAVKAYRRTLIVIREARFMGHDCDPFELEAARRALGDVRHITQHIPATPWRAIPDLYARLGDGSAAACLRLLILTLARSDACLGARKDEFDGGVWTIPADRVKGAQNAARDFRVPLSIAAQELIERQAAAVPGPLLFPSGRPGRPIRSAALERLLDSLGERGRPHGMRSAFKTWTQDTDAASWEISESVLGHAVGNSVARAYARSDFLERRRFALETWAGFVTGSADNNVIRIRTNENRGL